MIRRPLPILGLLCLATPAPAGEPAETLSGPAADVAAAERAFARRCGEVGIRDSFLEFFAADALSFGPEPGSAKQRLEKRPKPARRPPVSLLWGPEQVSVTPGGDMGWSTGPSIFKDDTGARPPHYGTYFSVWRKEADGAWKVVIDVGTDAPDLRPVPEVATAVPPSDAPGKEGGAAAIEREDRAFCRRAARGAARAFAAALEPAARVHRDGALPLAGAAAWRPWAKGLEGVVTCETQGAVSSSGPGFGFAYGSWERRDKAGGDVKEKGYYARVWRHVKAGWRIAVDVGTLVE